MSVLTRERINRYGDSHTGGGTAQETTNERNCAIQTV
jgi:hypothetical protein